jgi:hypothetical protein
MADRPTYDELFDLLSQLGFIKADPNPWEWVFWHERSDTVLLFSLLGEENTAQPVREAGLTTRAFGQRVTAEPLTTAR